MLINECQEFLINKTFHLVSEKSFRFWTGRSNLYDREYLFSKTIKDLGSWNCNLIFRVGETGIPITFQIQGEIALIEPVKSFSIKTKFKSLFSFRQNKRSIESYYDFDNFEINLKKKEIEPLLLSLKEEDLSIVAKEKNLAYSFTFDELAFAHFKFSIELMENIIKTELLKNP